MANSSIVALTLITTGILLAKDTCHSFMAERTMPTIELGLWCLVPLSTIEKER